MANHLILRFVGERVLQKGNSHWAAELSQNVCRLVPIRPERRAWQEVIKEVIGRQ